MTNSPAGRSPLGIVAPLAFSEAIGDNGNRHVEFYTTEGLLTFLWAGDPAATQVVICMGGAMGGLLGPARSLFHELAMTLPQQGVGVMRVGYRRPGDLERCLVDVAAAAESAAKVGAERFIFLGHSFGGAVAVQAAVALADTAAGVATFATQSAGCERADELDGVPFLLFHGDQDRILPADASHMVRMLAGYGDLRILEGADHLLSEASDEIRMELYPWIEHSFALPPSEGPAPAVG